MYNRLYLGLHIYQFSDTLIKYKWCILVNMFDYVMSFTQVITC